MRKIRPAWWTLSELAIATTLTLVGPASADWLVTREGAALEASGPWTVQGALVVFTLPNGTLSAMRLSEVDLDRSVEATREAENPPSDKVALSDKAALTAPNEVAFELTDEDIQRAAPSPSPITDVAAAMKLAGAPEGVTINQPYGLLNWTLEPRGNGIEIKGYLVYNGEDESVDGLNMIVRLSTADGVSFAETSAALTTPMLRKGAGTTFRAAFSVVQVEDFRADVEVLTRQGRRR